MEFEGDLDTYDDLDEAVETRRRANLDAERNVLAAMMLSTDAVWTVQAILRPEDFSEPRHETLARLIVGIVQAGGAADPTTVADAIARQGLERQTGGAAYLFELDTPTAANVQWHAEIVRERAIRRGLRTAAQTIHSLAGEPGDGSMLLERAQRALDLASTRTARRAVPIGDEFDGFLDALSEQSPNFGSPWPKLDELTGGFAPGRLYVIAARPGAGKTIMGVQIADALTRFGAVAYSSLEMERREIIARIVANRASVNLAAFGTGHLDRRSWDRVASVRSDVSALPLYVDDSADIYLADVQAHARAVARRTPLAGVVVDYLGLLSIPSDRRSRWEHFSEISHQLKRMAKTLRAPVIALQQLGREVEAGGKIRPPVLSDIRDTGSIEQDADVVALLHRPKDDPKNAPETLSINLAKNRHGKTGAFRLGWHPEFARVSPIEPPMLVDPEEQS